MKTQITDLLSFSKEKTLRQDFDYHLYNTGHFSNYYSFTELFQIIPPTNVSIDDLYSPFQYCEIGNTNKSGEASPVILNFSERNLLDEDYYKKIENGNIMPVEKDNILISKVRPNLKSLFAYPMN